MYFFEWMFWWGSTFDEKQRDADWLSFIDKRQKKLGVLNSEKPVDLSLSESSCPRARGPVYAFNDTFLEMRSGSLEHYRGLLTPLALTAIWFVGVGGFHHLYWIIDREWQDRIVGNIIALFLFGSVTFCFWYCFFKFKLYIPVRWELFTQRRLLIRFNRKTRQVYLHRPKYAGGVMILPWEEMVVALEGPGMPLLLGWIPQHTGLPFATFAAVGKRAGRAQELLDEWEFIRCYMEEGPESVPRPRVRSKIPWPWYSLEPQFEGLGPILRHGDWKLWLGKVLISPAFLTLGAGHWVSQLLCWEPRWPKIIREAGQPGKPTPKLTTAEDYDPETCRRLHLNKDMWVPSEQGGGNAININIADAGSLAELEGIGLNRARAIVAYREQHGNFDEPEQLQLVPGVGPELVRQNLWRMTTAPEQRDMQKKSFSSGAGQAGDCKPEG